MFYIYVSYNSGTVKYGPYDTSEQANNFLDLLPFEEEFIIAEIRKEYEYSS